MSAGDTQAEFDFSDFRTEVSEDQVDAVIEAIEPATDPDEREELQAELDAATFHAYGLDREQTQLILDDFHRVRDPPG